MITYAYKAKILYVVDGDTVDAQIDIGFKMTTVQRLRLLGVDTHELRDKDEHKKQSAIAAKDWLAKEIWNKDVVIQTQKTDSFGRYLADIYLGERYINAEIVEKGFSK